MNVLEFRRIIEHVPGIKNYRLEQGNNSVVVYLTFKWYAKPLENAMIVFLAEVFTYLHMPGTRIVFMKGDKNVPSG